MTSVTTTPEVPLFFPAGADTLFGVLTMSPSDGDLGAIILGGGSTPSTTIGRNRIFVTMARHVASLGFRTLRFDYHGVGDSTGESTIRLDRPFVDDLAAAVQVLSDQGVKRCMLIGSCFGARTALAGGGRVAGIGGAVLLAPPLRDFALSERKTEGWALRDYLRALVHPQGLIGGGRDLTLRRYLRFVRSGFQVGIRRLRRRISPKREAYRWISPDFLNGLSTLVELGLPILFVYGTEDESYPDWQDALRGPLGGILERAGAVEISIISGQVHGFTQTETQSVVIHTVGAWLTRVTGSNAGTTTA